MFIKFKSKQIKQYTLRHICDKLFLKNEIDKNKIQDSGYLWERCREVEQRSSPWMSSRTPRMFSRVEGIFYYSVLQSKYSAYMFVYV